MKPRRPIIRLPWRSRERIRTDLENELRFHLDMRTEELVSTGMNEHDARLEARREFGDLDYTRRYCEALDRSGDRSVRRAEWLGDLAGDVRHAFRGVLRHRAYSAVAVLTLALGIGANVAVFSVLESVLLRSTPYAEPHRIVSVDEDNRPSSRPRSDVAVADFLDWRRDQRTLEGIAAYGYSSLILGGGATPQALQGSRVTSNFFEVLGVQPALGRTFRPGEDEGVNRVVVLTDGLWRRVFGADSSIVGRQISLSGDSYTVVGVLRPDFVFPRGTPEYFRPVDLTSAMADVNRARKFHFLHAFARLKPGATLDQARADLQTIAQRLEREHPTSNTGHLVTVLPLDEALVGDVRIAILVLMGAAGFVLLIACANLANLALSRALARRRELAVRVALGASRGRLLRQTLTESTVLSLLGGLAGIAVAWSGTPALLALYPNALPPTYDVHVNPIAFLFALAVAVVAGLAFGVVPAFVTLRRDPNQSLRDGSRGSTGGVSGNRARRVLIVGQLALATVLLVGAGLLVRTLSRLQGVELGFVAENVSVTNISVAGARYREAPAIVEFWNRLVQRLGAEPGFTSVALSSSVPLAGGAGASIAIEDQPVVGQLPEVRYAVASADYFKTMGIPLRSGRFFTPDDGANAQRVAIINETAARKFWPGRNPIGARIRLGPDPSVPWNTVVGVVSDYRYEGIDLPPRPLVLTSHQQDVWPGLFVSVKSTRTPLEVHGAIVRAMRELDSALPVADVHALTEFVSNRLGQRRFMLSLLGIFATIALVVAVIGVYGVISYMVTARTQEFGIRIALGAFPRQVVAAVLKQGLGLAFAGLVLGVLGAAAVTRFLAGLLFGVQPLDAATFGAVGALLTIAAAAACWVPARRAAGTEPIQALRNE